MVTKETIKSAIERVPADGLAELYEAVKSFAKSRPPSSQPSLMSKLQRLRINAPPDFAENIDLYLSGEKTFE